MTRRTRNGFLLPELLVAMAVAVVLVGQIARATLQDTGLARRLGRQLRERMVAQRALELIRTELQQALEVHQTLPASGHAGCGLSGRDVKLHLLTAAGPITYSVESSPDAIWRGKALMRCGPTYDLAGQLQQDTNESRVLVDALAEAGLTVQAGGIGLSLGLIRRFDDPQGAPQLLSSSLASPSPGLRP